MRNFFQQQKNFFLRIFLKQSKPFHFPPFWQKKKKKTFFISFSHFVMLRAATRGSIFHVYTVQIIYTSYTWPPTSSVLLFFKFFRRKKKIFLIPPTMLREGVETAGHESQKKEKMDTRTLWLGILYAAVRSLARATIHKERVFFFFPQSIGHCLDPKIGTSLSIETRGGRGTVWYRHGRTGRRCITLEGRLDGTLFRCYEKEEKISVLKTTRKTRRRRRTFWKRLTFQFNWSV